MGKIFEGLKAVGKIGVEIGENLWGGIKAALNAGIRAVNNMIPNKIGIGPASIDLPDNPIPTLARGVSSFGGGSAILGEHGRELAILPQKSKVYPAHRTESMFESARRGAEAAGSGGDDRPIIVQFHLDGRMIEQSLIRRTRDTGRPLQITVRPA